MLGRAVTRLDRLLTFRRACTYAALLIAIYASAWLYVVVNGSPPLNSSGEPIGGDYIAFHAAGRLVLSGEGARLYERAAVAAVQDNLLQGQRPGFYDAFRNPPFFALLFAPLSALDLLSGYAVWTVLSVAALGVAVALLVAGEPALRARWRGVAILVLGFAPVYFGLINGQNATLSLLLYVLLYRALRQHQPVRAGVWAALGLFKPQLFVLFPLLFVVRRCWRAIAAYAVVAAVLALVCVGLVGIDGVDSWLRILATQEATNAAANGWRMHSLKSFFDQLLPTHTAAALGLYAALSLALLAMLAHAWSRTEVVDPRLWIVTCLVAVLVDPHLLDYDLTVLVPAGALAAVHVPGLRWWMVLLYPLLIARAQLPVITGTVPLATP
ncbi:MAG: DUF2029 domain-containing protein, partial [Chloroflexota bacterium]|nr:DUF2029 domain-containing protein [Chloroflexota bacterium]